MSEDNVPKKFKDRNQSLLDFYNSLQREYVVAELRSKIYPKSKDKKYYRRVMEGKKETIVQISERNHLPNIFSNMEVSKEISDEIIPDWGTPNFTYRNKDTEKWMKRNDQLNYFAEGVDFAVKLDHGDVCIAKIIDNKKAISHGELTLSERGGKSFTFKTEYLKRII